MNYELPVCHISASKILKRADVWYSYPCCQINEHEQRDKFILFCKIVHFIESCNMHVLIFFSIKEVLDHIKSSSQSVQLIKVYSFHPAQIHSAAAN